MSSAIQKEHIVRLVAELDDGTFIVEHPDGRLERQRDETDWARLDAMTDEEIEAAMRDDPDWADLIDFDWSDAAVVRPGQKKAISIRLDSDVLDFFRREGRGYQTHINAVLRSYMEQRGKEAAGAGPAKGKRRA